MELVEGPSLRALLDRLGPTTPEGALVVLHGSLLRLSAAHRVGVVHRDYKLDNILVQADGTSRLATSTSQATLTRRGGAGRQRIAMLAMGELRR